MKRLELAGFKSFADKTELEFVQGITGVVGPNGSGKSNISDAIRWVLGEQSAKSLRGGKMEDIIFAGSDARKAVNYGEVSLTLDNTDQALSLDYSEVTVTRRVHRNGDSDYLINKQPCRLKDITELFMDTGIGKEAYSIIGQGRIEEILSTRSEDRRGIFEEASGIVKYKSRKKEARRKLEDTEQNLLRIHDLVSELEDQIEPLKEQSAKAKHFIELKDTLKSKEISMYVFQIEQIHRSWTETNERLTLLKSEQLKLSSVVSKHDAELEKHRLESRRLEVELEQLQTALLQISEELEKCEGYGELLKERDKNLKQNREQLTISAATATKRIADKLNEMTLYETKHQTIQAELAKLKAGLYAEEERLLGVAGGTSSETEERLKGELLEILNEMAQFRNEIRYAEQQTETIGRRMERLNEDGSKWTEQKETVEQRKKELNAAIEATVAEISDIRNKYIALGDTQRTTQTMLDQVQQTLRKWEQKMDALVSRKDTMQEMQNDYDGFMHGVKEVLKARGKADGLKGVRGAVAELVKVPQELETAMETALGAALQHIVMDNELTAREAIGFLKKRQLGRATFLPLDVIKGRYISESDKRSIVSAEGFVGIGAELVSFEPTYEGIVYSLLGNVVIAQTLEQANRIAARCQYRFRIVTLDGDVVNAGGSMTGGSVQKKGASLLGRQRQIDQLEDEIATTTKQISELRNKLFDLKKDLTLAGQSIEQLRESSEQKRLEEQQLRAELNQLETEMRHAEEQLLLFAQDRGVYEKEIAEHARAKAAAESKLAEHQTGEQRLHQMIRDAELSRKANESAKEELQSQMTDMKVKVAALSQEQQSLSEQLARIKEELRHEEQELGRTKQLLKQADSDAETNQQESVKQIEDLNHYRIKRQQYTEQIDFKRAERTEWLGQLEQGENETKEQRTELRQVEDKLRHTEVSAGRLDVELENLLKKLAEEYDLSFELAKERYPVPEDVLGTQNSVRDLKRQIAALGIVNLGAIEEYERVSERYSFLSEQKQDLIEAKTTLYQVIREMDDEMSKRFRSTFEAIRGHFVVVFARLFGGGRADLVLAEPDNILESGVDIVAQPPGKKLQNLQLLSGGERALTAIALLFAILLVKPVPFCVLDEVEAALDEANVSRFAQYLRDFSQETQFIVVTHRKGTMEEADVLYGVTMEEGGVSKLVSVRLEDDEPVSA